MKAELVTRQGVKAVFKPVCGYEGIYSVTDDGRVYSHARIDARGNRRNGKWLKAIPDGDGYLRVHLCVNAVRIKKGIHRLVASAFLKNPSSLPAINHKDNDKTNNSVDNLEWVTMEDNSRKAYNDGLYTQPRGTDGRFYKKAVV